MASLEDIAQRAGVSASTVFRVLNGQVSASLPEDTQAQIHALAKDLNYRPKSRRRRAASHGIKNIAIIGLDNAAHDADVPFFQRLTGGLQQECFRAGLSPQHCRLLWSDAVGSYDQFNDDDGIIVVGGNSPATEYFSKTSHRVIFVADSPDPERFCSVQIDLAMGTRQLVEHLLSLGYTELGYLGPDERNDPASRLVTFQAELGRRNLDAERYLHLNGDWRGQSGFEMAQRAVAEGRVARAYFGANDPMAIGAISGFAAAGLRVPEDVAVVGFDNIELSAYSRPALTTVESSPERCAQVAVKLLTDGWGAMALPAVQILLPTSLVVRESSGAQLE